MSWYGNVRQYLGKLIGMVWKNTEPAKIRKVLIIKNEGWKLRVKTLLDTSKIEYLDVGVCRGNHIVEIDFKDQTELSNTITLIGPDLSDTEDSCLMSS